MLIKTHKEPFQLEPASFRDPNGHVFYISGNVYRSLSKQALLEWINLSETEFFIKYSQKGVLVPTELVPTVDAFEEYNSRHWAGYLKHEKIPFISYPYEWSFGMLKDAAILQLEIIHDSLESGLSVKDSSAFNFQLCGTQLVFIDIPSFEKRKEGEPWIGYRQFCQMFLYPLMLQAYKDVPFQDWYRGNIEGVAPSQMRSLLSIRDWFRSGVVMDVVLHAKAERRYENSVSNIKRQLRKAGFSKEMIQSNIRRLQRVVKGLTLNRTESQWSHYVETNNYSDKDHHQKVEFVKRYSLSQHWKLVWDLGCNTGEFSHIAVQSADYVVAMDADPYAIERLYQYLKLTKNKKILPIVGNVLNPSPNLGWQGTERRTLLDRGKPDLILCLALIHHIVISANVPLEQFIQWLASLGHYVIIEFVEKSDPMVQKLLVNKDLEYEEYRLEVFEKIVLQEFVILAKESETSGTRTLYFLQKT